MRIEIYDNILKFTDDVMDVLMQNEIQNNLIISNCLRGKDGMDTSDWFMGVVKDAGGAIQTIALMTPPYNLVAYESGNKPNNEAVLLLVQELFTLQIPVPGILSEKSLAIRFADMYSRISRNSKIDGKAMRIYRLDRVNVIPQSSGKLRLAEQRDLYFLPYWNIGFTLDCGFKSVDIPGATDKVKRLLNDKTLYIWEDDIPVSQAAMGRRTLNGAILNAVYTPPHYREKGYASSCVAGLSQLLLDNGYKFCSLFTDLANPISNSIYMRIGYKPVCDYDEYFFVVQ